MATLFAVATILYSCLWMYVVRHPAPVELGFDPQYSSTSHSLAVEEVLKGSPAEEAGLRVGDRIVAVNGRRLETMKPFDEVWFRSQPGDSVELTVSRSGQPDPLTLRGIFRAAKPQSSEGGLARASALEVVDSYPVVFLVVGLPVLFLRVDDPSVWLLALLFGGFIAVPEPMSFAPLHPPLQAFAMAYRSTFLGLFASLFYLFFAVFPTRSPLDRRWPMLKWAAFALAACVIVPGLSVGHIAAPAAFVNLVGAGIASKAAVSYIYLFVVLGLISLIANSRRSSAPEASRKTRVIMWGTMMGVVPIAAEKAAVDFAGYQPPFWLDTIMVVVSLLFPLSFAYAVVKHRVLEIPVLLKRSARYVLVQRGFIVLLLVVAACAIVFFTRIFTKLFGMASNVGMAASAVFGIVMVWVSAPIVRRGTERIDRAFFRSAYDARVILQDLAEKARTVNDRRDLAALIERHINEALHPKSLAVYIAAGEGSLVAERGAVLPELQTIPSTLPLLSELVDHGKSWDVPPPADNDSVEKSPLAAMTPECLVPILGRDGRLVGLLVLGQRLSEEPYSREDKHLLDSVASQAGISLESIRLAEEMVGRMQAERRVADELEIARQVQTRLLPQTMPPMQTLEYAGGCIQARRVGGDYYDFLELGPGRLGLVLADISGKGISGALLMANLQANLRSQYAIALEDLSRLLKSVNRLFYENTPNDSYATLFFGDYDDTNRCLRYANCGHNAPLLLRADGTIERLHATTTVLGLFREWECPTRSACVNPGDLLIVYTDGITEAPNNLGQEYGEARLTEAVLSLRDLPVEGLLAGIQASVQQFGGGDQADDLTLVIGRVR